MEGRIVSDEASYSTRIPDYQTHTNIITEGKPSYDRLDSGISSQLDSLNLNDISCPVSPAVKSPEPGYAEYEADSLWEQDADGDSQLHLACATQAEDVVFALIRLAPHPACLDLQNNEMYAPLHIAVLTNQPSLVRRLVVAGARVEPRDQEGNTPLHLASKRGYLECAEALLRSITVQELQEAGVDSKVVQHSNTTDILNMKNYHGEHCVHLATFGQHYSFLQFLAWIGADLNATEGRSGKTALHYAVNKRDCQLVKLLALPRLAGGCGVFLNQRDWAGRTPVQCAAINGDADIVADLTGLGCDTTAWESEESGGEGEEETSDCRTQSYTDIEMTRVLASTA